MSVLKVDRLHIATNGGHTLLEPLSFDIQPGEFVAVVGESGSGKTMAARAVLDLLPPGVRRAGGSIQLQGRDLTGLSPAAMRKIRGGEIGMVFQEPMTSLNPALSIGTQLAEGLKLHRGLPKAEIRRLCLAMLSRVRIKDPERCLASFPHEFSGGMRQRVMLASVLLLKPKLLIADEPTTALDTLNQREVLDIMVELARDEGVAILLITHDLGVVARYANRVVVLEKGKLIEIGAAREVLAHSKQPYTQRLIASLPHRAAARPPVSGEVLLSVEQCCVDYPGKSGILRAGAPERVVRQVDLTVRTGEIVALVGASGSGKSTLGRAILGLKPLAAGRVRFAGQDVAAMTGAQLRDFRRAAQLVFQDPFSSLDPRIRIKDIVGAVLRHVPALAKAERQEQVRQVLDDVGLSGFGERFPHQMSGGQRQRIAIARAIVSRPRLVVADEPVSALDVTIQRQILDLLQNLQRQYGFACLFVTHDLMVVQQIADRVVVLSGGAIVEQGPVTEVFAAPKHDYTQALLAATPGFAVEELAKN